MTMTIKEKIKKAYKIYVWCNTCSDDGTYIQVTKSALLKSIKERPENFDAEKFDLQDVNIPNALVNLYVD